MVIAAQLIWSGEVTPIEDNYVEITTSTTEYEPRICCIATVGILGESCSSIDGSNVSKWSKSWFADRFKRFLPRRHCRGVLGHCRGVLGIVRSPN